MQPSWALPKLTWLSAQNSIEDGARLLHQVDLITWRLAGRQLPTGASHVLKTGYDLLADEWSERSVAGGPMPTWNGSPNAPRSER